jgi:hypothetical protein
VCVSLAASGCRGVYCVCVCHSLPLGVPHIRFASYSLKFASLFVPLLCVCASLSVPLLCVCASLSVPLCASPTPCLCVCLTHSLPVCVPDPLPVSLTPSLCASPFFSLCVLSLSLTCCLSGGIECFHPHARRVLTHMLTKPMQQANYFCTGDQPEDNWGHYALSMPRYTHFTSPIRRYPDLMVHRLLQQAINLAAASSPAEQVRAQLLATCQAAALRDVDKWAETPESEEATGAIQKYMNKRQADLSDKCVNCNLKKSNAKKASDASTYVFLAVTLRACPLEVDGVVMAVGASYLNIIAVGFDIEAKCYLDDCALLESHIWDDKAKTLALKWKDCAVRPEPAAAGEGAASLDVEVKQLSVVKVLLYTKENVVPLQIAMRLVPSLPSQ